MKRWEVKTPWVTRDWCDDWGIKGLDWVCGSELDDLFSVPDEARHVRIWVSSHSDPDSLAIYLEHSPSGDDENTTNCDMLNWSRDKEQQYGIFNFTLEQWGIKQGQKLGLLSREHRVLRVYVSVEWRR